ncbi:tetratricopeptide repeat protein [Gracilimonas halophila]|uniref:Tetratricopeptide repeat protein n=1 Tax=Gracilimonas halophila TaxID=1834464 RepID=A0ABW5JJ64_9BACT
MKASFIILFSLLIFSDNIFAQLEYNDEFLEPMPLYEEALGDFTREISSDNKEAQAYFDQGYQMMYAFAKGDAARSFYESRQKDPSCAICWWGEAWTWGPYLNGGMRDWEAPKAYATIQEALRLSKDHATDKERAIIEATAVRYVEDFENSNRAALDSAYADAMREVYERYPDDSDIGTLYAEALFLLEPRRGTRDVNDPDVQFLHGVLEGILEKDIKHPGACHLYIHATESTQKPELAEPCAEFIGNSIPGASHINHMPSHTWNEVGRWNDAVRANIQAWHSDQKAAVGKGFAIYPSHNLHMLLFAASMDGQGALAIQAGKDYAKLTGNNMYHVLTLVRFGRFDEIPAINEKPEGDVALGMWHFSQGYAAVKLDNMDTAYDHLEELQELAANSDGRFRFHSAENLLGTVQGILVGEIYRMEGDKEAALKAFQEGVRFYDQLDYDEPEPLPFSPRHWLGAHYLEMEKFEEAARTFNKELENHPNNGWSLYGLLEAEKAMDIQNESTQKAFDKSWARSDTWIRGSKF